MSVISYCKVNNSHEIKIFEEDSAGHNEISSFVVKYDFGPISSNYASIRC